MTELGRLNLRDNELTGAIPPELGDLANLEALWLGDNRLTGEIPAELAGLTTLNRLQLGPNNFSATACMPASFRNIAVLELGGLDIPFCDEPVGVG